MKKTFFLFYKIILIMLMIISPSVLSLRISPDSYIFTYSPGKTETFSFNVGADLGESLKIFEVKLEGSLADYSSVDIKEIEVGPSKGGIFNVKINVPDLPPGKHSLNIKLFEKHEETTEYGKKEGGGIRVAISVIPKVVTVVPYPNKFMNAIFSFPYGNRVKKGEKIYFLANIQSQGKELIDNVEGSIMIVEGKKEVAIVPFTKISQLLPLSSGKLYAEFDTSNAIPGKYEAMPSFNYDGVTINLSKYVFLIGDKDLILESNNLTLINGEINQVFFKVRSVWNEKIKFNAELIIDDPQGGNLIKTKSIDYEVIPWTTQEISLFLDAKQIPQNNYHGKFKLFFEGEEREFPLEIEVKNGQTKTEIIKEEKSESSSKLTMIIVTIIIITLIIIAYFWKKKSSEENEF